MHNVSELRQVFKYFLETKEIFEIMHNQSSVDGIFVFSVLSVLLKSQKKEDLISVYSHIQVLAIVSQFVRVDLSSSGGGLVFVQNFKDSRGFEKVSSQVEVLDLSVSREQLVKLLAGGVSGQVENSHETGGSVLQVVLNY